jgi:hypothetical protein
MTYISHLADNKSPFILTACGISWQGWQAPKGYADIPDHKVLPPFSEPRPHIDRVEFCEACQKLAREDK